MLSFQQSAQRRIINFRIVTAINGQVLDFYHAINSRPIKAHLQGSPCSVVELIIRLNHQTALPTMLHERRPLDASVLLRDALHCEWIQSASRIVHFCGTAPEKPKASGRIHFPSVSSSMPHRSINGEFRFLVTAPAEIALQHVLT